MNFNCDNLAKLRNQTGYSQEYMAELLNMNHATYNRLENNKRNLKLEDIPKLASAFKISMAEVLEVLLGWQMPPPRKIRAMFRERKYIRSCY